MIDLFSQDGVGRFFPTPYGKYANYISAWPVIREPVKKQKGWRFDDDVDQVFSIDFLLPDGEVIREYLIIEVKGCHLHAKPILCGISPEQIRNAIIQVITKLNFGSSAARK